MQQRFRYFCSEPDHNVLLFFLNFRFLIETVTGSFFLPANLSADHCLNLCLSHRCNLAIDEHFAEKKIDQGQRRQSPLLLEKAGRKEELEEFIGATKQNIKHKRGK